MAWLDLNKINISAIAACLIWQNAEEEQKEKFTGQAEGKVE